MLPAQPPVFEATDQGEEAARADLYGLLATLFYVPPSQQLLEAIAATPADGDGVLQRAWLQLSAVCQRIDVLAARDEYEALFIGVGKPDLMLYGSYYLSGFLMEKPLAALRDDLATLGLQRGGHMPESEDHIAALCEVMRFLIASSDVQHVKIATQQRFFAQHLQPWVNTMCDALISHPRADFYVPVAALARAFFEVETQAFDMA